MLERLELAVDPTGEYKRRLKQRVRESVTPAQKQDLKRAVGEFESARLEMRSLLPSVEQSACADNVYHAAVQKTGSQWISSVFDDARIRRVSGLASHPQFRYEWGEFRGRFPRYTFVPGLFISRGLYDEITKPDDHRTFYVMRDPRDIVVSWYYSMRDSHRPMGKVVDHRRRLRNMDRDEGLAYCIRAFQLKFAFMRSWAYAADDPKTLFVKLEDLSADPVGGFSEIMDHCGIELSTSKLEEVLADYTKDKMRQRDLRTRSDDERSHYRQTPSDWREVFTAEHRELFRDVTGDLVELLGYDTE